MQTRISKTLEGIIARTAFDTAKAGIERSLKDYLMLEILRTDASTACQIVKSQIRGEMLVRIIERIREKAVTMAPQGDARRPEIFFADYLRQLAEEHADKECVTSVQVLFDILDDPSTASSHVFTNYQKAMLSIARDRLNSHPTISTRIFIRDFDDHKRGDFDDQKRGDFGDQKRGDFNTPKGDFDDSRRVDFNDHNKSDFDGGVSGSSDFGQPVQLQRSSQPLLEKFGTDLTKLAREGGIDPVVGRTAEIERVVQILSRRKKNNPVLIGEAGVGKSAVVEGLALRIAAGEVPYTISRKRIFSLDLSSLVAGTKYRGEFEERIQQILDELRRSDDTILFIDEIHTIVGAGSTSGSLDTANILKPALARGELQTIGATTFDEYRQTIEHDAALERRFQKVMIEPASREETLQILRSIAPAYERHHNVRYTEAALQACVELTDRYITERHFPDKAIDILDEAGSCAHLASSRRPESLREMEASLAEAERERREAVAALTYDKAAAARVREIELKSKIGEGIAEWRRSLEMNPATVDADNIAAVITSVTGIPAERIAGGELERIRTLQERLSARIIGQDEAVASVAKAIRRSRSGLKDANRPVGVFMFVGPTGVGKTLLAKELSNLLFDGEQGLVRLDMSEYTEKHNVARLIGSPPGYVGYGEGGQLTEAVRRHPYSVVLFDEIEKAHPDIFNTMLQIFDEGHLTDGSGRKVDFRNTVIIMTSNIGSRTAAVKSSQIGYLTPSKAVNEAASSDEYRKALETAFAPEFLNRVDDVVVFRTLEAEDVERIVELELQGVFARASKLGLSIRITDGAKRELAALGYESRYGVRALRRTLTDEVEEPLSTLIIEGKLRDGDKVVIEKSKLGGVTFKVA